MPARRSALPCTLVVLALLSACGGGGGGTASPAGGAGPSGQSDDRPVKKGGELVLALAEDPDVLDPSLGRTLVGREVFVNMCEKLYDVDESLAIVPQLAAALPEISTDGLSVTITLRTGVTFNDGTPFDAAAVKTSLDRHVSIKGSARKSELAAVSGVEVVDPTTVKLTLKAPFAPLTGQLADRAGMVMSPAQLTKLGDDFGSSPVCVGPFSFVSRQAGNSITLKKSTEYYDAASVNLDGITYKVITDANVRLANVRSGDVQVSERISATDVDDVESDASVKLVTGEPLGYQGISINVGNTAGVGEPVGTVTTPLGTDKELRRAFELALDRKVINQVVFAGKYVPGCFPLPPGNAFLDSSLTCLERDVDEAKKIIQASGVPSPVPVELTIGTSPENLRIGQIIQSLAKEAGFDVKVKSTEFASALDASDAGKYEAFQVGWSGRVDPDGNINDFLATGGARNISGLSNPQVDAALATSRATTDMAERKTAFTEALKISAEERPIIYLYHQRNYLVSTAQVSGIAFYADGLPRLKTAGLTA